MYLVSIYFDEKTNKQIQRYINRVAEKTGNSFMLDGNVPPHLTISAFQTKWEKEVVSILEKEVQKLSEGKIIWASLGIFLPYVIYLTPVLNQYLHNVSQTIYNGISTIEDIQISATYRPFQWLPHTTIGKKLTKEQMRIAFEVLQGEFGVLEGTVTKIGLAKTNPYRDIVSFEL